MKINTMKINTMKINTMKIDAMRKLIATLMCLTMTAGCTTELNQRENLPESTSEMMIALYDVIKEPFIAQFTYVQKTYDQDTKRDDIYEAIKTTVTQDEDYDVSIINTGRWWNKSVDYILESDKLYVRNRESGTYAPPDIAGVDLGEWVPYYEWVSLNLERTESLVLNSEDFAPGVIPERPYLARSPLNIVSGEQFNPVPETCVRFEEGIPKEHIKRLDKRRWRIKCETSLGVLDTFFIEFDDLGRLTRFHNGPTEYLNGAVMHDLKITYKNTGDIEKPALSWWNKNKETVGRRLADMASELYDDNQ